MISFLVLLIIVVKLIMVSELKMKETRELCRENRPEETFCSRFAVANGIGYKITKSYWLALVK